MATGVDDRVWKRLVEKVGQLAQSQVHVGVLASRGGNAIHDEESGLTLIEIAAIHEFGSPAAGIPERSFIRATAELFRDEFARLQVRVARAILADQMTVPQALGMLGAWLVAKIKQRMSTGTGVPPPLAEATLEARRAKHPPGPPQAGQIDRPLIDTGRLWNSIQWEVVLSQAEAEAG